MRKGFDDVPPETMKHRWGNGVEEHSGSAFSLGHCKGQRQLAKEKREEVDVKMKKKGRKYVVKKVTRKLKDGARKCNTQSLPRRT